MAGAGHGVAPRRRDVREVIQVRRRTARGLRRDPSGGCDEDDVAHRLTAELGFGKRRAVHRAELGHALLADGHHHGGGRHTERGQHARFVRVGADDERHVVRAAGTEREPRRFGDQATVNERAEAEPAL